MSDGSTNYEVLCYAFFNFYYLFSLTSKYSPLQPVLEPKSELFLYNKILHPVTIYVYTNSQI